MDLLESAFLSKTQKLNKKRQEQLNKRVERLLPEIESAYEKGDKEELEGIFKSIQIPSSKEWKKNIHSLVLNSAQAGVLRAHVELMRLKELYTFSEYDWKVNVVREGSDYEVVFPKEAQDWIRDYGYEIGVITEDTVRERIRMAVEKGLVEGMRGRDLNQLILDVTQTWLGMGHAETIARTETAKMYNAGRIARWSDPELNGFVEALQYDAIVDTRTTDFCRNIDGKIISMDNAQAIAEYTPPNHFRCRATWIPVTEFEAWKDDFPLDEKPPKGFQFEAPLPHLLKGKTEPLVQIKPEKLIDPSKIVDTDLIRNLPDEDFIVAIGNVTDLKVKLGMVKERAEQMLVKDEVLDITTPTFSFDWYGFNRDTLEGTFEAFDKKYKFHMTPAIEDDIYELTASLRYLSAQEFRDTLDAYTKKNASSLAHLDVVRVFREAFESNIKENAKLKKGFVKAGKKSADEKKLMKIKTPPQTKNYKTATGLQEALGKGQEWIDEFVVGKLAPKSGVVLKFENDLRRAYAKGGGGTIHFGRYETDPAVIVHEFAHILHWQHKELVDMTNEWFMQRTNNLTLTKSSLYGEENIPDSFFHSYIGRLYGWEGDKRYVDHFKAQGMTSGELYGQEVVSMGFQAMYEDPAKFYNDDKDHFLYIYGLMKGLF